LSKLCLEYCGLFFLGHGVYIRVGRGKQGREVHEEREQKGKGGGNGGKGTGRDESASPFLKIPPAHRPTIHVKGGTIGFQS